MRVSLGGSHSEVHTLSTLIQQTYLTESWLWHTEIVTLHKARRTPALQAGKSGEERGQMREIGRAGGSVILFSN